MVTTASLSTADLVRVVAPGVVQLKCAEPGVPTIRQSLGGLFLTPKTSSHDLVLVAAHGLAGELAGCRLLWQQQELSVIRSRRGDGGKVAGDWAVLTLNGRFQDQPQRFAWRSVTPDDFLLFSKASRKVYVLRHPSGEVG